MSPRAGEVHTHTHILVHAWRKSDMSYMQSHAIVCVHTSQKRSSFLNIQTLIYTLGVHIQEGYGICLVYLSVYMSLASTSFVSTFQVRYVQLSCRLFLIFDSWIFDKTFRSKVMA